VFLLKTTTIDWCTLY